MARTSPREQPDRETVLWPIQKDCPACGFPMRIRYENRRTVVTLSGTQRLCLKIRRCEQVGCARQGRAYRPEAEGAIALSHHEFGLDVIALSGVQRHRQHRSVPEIHQALRAQGVAIAERSVTNLLDRYDELLATALTDSGRLRALLAAQGRVILALDGLQPDVGHEVLWVIRDCLSGEVLLARSLLSGTAADLAPLLRAGHRRGQRRPDLDPPCGGTRAARGSSSTLPFSLFTRGSTTGLRGRPARQDDAEETYPWRSPDRARGGGGHRPASRGGARLLCGGAQRHHR